VILIAIENPNVLKIHIWVRIHGRKSSY
jgi:hypothetical protein